MAISPAIIVNDNDNKANGRQIGSPRRAAATEARPDTENNKSAGRKD